MRILAFTGKMGAGKSTAIEQLGYLYDGTIKLIKFAKPLYDIQEYVYRRIQSVHRRPEDFVKDRKLLQWLGTEWGRNSISESLWVDIWKHDAQTSQERHHLVVCDDLRYDNEAAAVKSIGGVVVKIENNSNARIDTTAGIQGHASELGIDNSLIDCIIDNSSDISDLRQSLLTMNSKLHVW